MDEILNQAADALARAEIPQEQADRVLGILRRDTTGTPRTPDEQQFISDFAGEQGRIFENAMRVIFALAFHAERLEKLK